MRQIESTVLLRLCVFDPFIIGNFPFLGPRSPDGTLNTVLGIIIDWAKDAFKPFLTVTAMILVVLSAIITVYATLLKPSSIMKNQFLRTSLWWVPFGLFLDLRAIFS